MKFGLISYNYTNNLGNEIQSIAARRFLPKIDYYIEHEKLNEFNQAHNVKTIMNAYYLDCATAWPPSENINPLLISIHFDTNNFTKDIILKEENKNYLREYGPVGCRDSNTYNLLQENDIDSYFSGCLTLTLENNQPKPELKESEKYIIINTTRWNEELYSFLKNKTDRTIYTIYQNTLLKNSKSMKPLSSFYNYKEKFYIAERLLNIYENAECVITDRLHASFPSLALKTPVILINKDHESIFDPGRFEGLSDYLLTSSLEDYIKDYNIFDVNNPPENSNKYLKVRKNLIKKCEEFTGCINPSYKSHETQNIDIKTMELLLKGSLEGRNLGYQYIRDLNRIENENKRYLKQIKSQKKLIEKQEKEINKLKNSNSWKITKPLRTFRNTLRKEKR